MNPIDATQLSDCLSKPITHILSDSVSIQVSNVKICEDAQPVRTEQGITVIIGVTGDLEGSFTLFMRDSVAIEYTRRLLDMDITEFDEVVASATGEFGNMVVAQCTMHFLALGRTCDLTPPTILRSQATEMRTPGSTMIASTFETEWGAIDGRIFVCDRKQ